MITTSTVSCSFFAWSIISSREMTTTLTELVGCFGTVGLVSKMQDQDSSRSPPENPEAHGKLVSFCGLLQVIPFGLSQDGLHSARV